MVSITTLRAIVAKMTLPSTQKKWILFGIEKGFDEGKLVDGPIPKVTSRGVLVKLHAASISGRELLIPFACRIVHVSYPYH